jgi:hypothetical protein
MDSKLLPSTINAIHLLREDVSTKLSRTSDVKGASYSLSLHQARLYRLMSVYCTPNSLQLLVCLHCVHEPQKQSVHRHWCYHAPVAKCLCWLFQFSGRLVKPCSCMVCLEMQIRHMIHLCTTSSTSAQRWGQCSIHTIIVHAAEAPYVLSAPLSLKGISGAINDMHVCIMHSQCQHCNCITDVMSHTAP